MSLCARPARVFACSRPSKRTASCGTVCAKAPTCTHQSAGGTAEELWLRYMQLTQAEASFRALKSELSIRPLFHQLESRVKAHVLVGFLGYALSVTLKHLLKRRAAIHPTAVSQRRQQCAAVIRHESARFAVDP